MSATNEMFIRMREQDFINLDNETRSLFTYVEVRESNEWETHKNDEKYRAYKKAESKAKEDTQSYLFNLRHKI